MTVHAISTARTNAELVEQVASLYAPADALARWLVLDPTPGTGGMWRRWRPRRLVQSRSDFTRPLGMPATFDLVLFDPPYVAKGGRATRASVANHDSRYGREHRDDRKTALTPAEVHRLVTVGMARCAETVKPGGQLWVKSADYVTSGRVHWGNHDVRCTGRELGLVQVDELMLRSTSPQPDHARQVHARRGFSTLTVWTKR